MMLAVVNESTLCAQSDVATWVAACQRQINEHWAPFTQQAPVSVTVFASDADVPADHDLVVILDDGEQAGVLGYHSVTPAGRPYGKVFARPCIDNGSPVSQCLSHELLEACNNPEVNMWADGDDGYQYPDEACDAVESNSYDCDGVQVSDFVGPRWYGSGAGPFNWLRTLTAPYQLAPGGYCARRLPGQEPVDVYGEEYPEWRKAMKAHPASRTAKLHAPKVAA